MTRSPATSDLDSTASFYSRIARAYDHFATSPLFSGLRERTVQSLSLESGDRVLEVGCGTGGNLPYVARRIGPNGTYVGVDVSRGMLNRGTDVETESRTVFVRGDATCLPVDGPFDAIVSTFLVGMLTNPARTVREWLDLLEDDGRLVLLDAAAREGRMGPLDLGFRTFVVLAAPPESRGRDRSPNRVLRERVDRAHRTLREDGTLVDSQNHWRGFVRRTAVSPDRY